MEQKRGLLREFRFDVLGIELEEESFATLERRIGDLEPFFEFVTREETNARSGRRVGLFLGYPASYLAITPRIAGEHKDFTIGLQSTRTGLLNDVRSVLSRIAVPFGYVTDELYGPNGASMPWYHSIEPAPGGTEIPVFFNEYADEYLDDIGLSGNTRDEIGRAHDGLRVLFSQVTLELSAEGQAVIRALIDNSTERFATEVTKLPVRDNSTLVVVPAHESLLREFRLPTQRPGNLDLGMIDSWRFLIADGTFVGRRVR